MPEFMNKSEFEEGFTGYITGAVVISRSALEKVGCFNPGLRIANDSDWFFRAKDAGMHLGIVDEVLVQRRIHDANQTLHREPESKAVKELFELVRESVHRKQ